MRKNFIAILLSMLLIVSNTIFVIANETDARLIAEGTIITPYVKDNAMYLTTEEYENIFYAFVTVNEDDAITVETYYGEEFVMELGSSIVLINDETTYDLGKAPFAENDEIYIPIRIAEMGEYKIFWDNAEKVAIGYEMEYLLDYDEYYDEEYYDEYYGEYYEEEYYDEEYYDEYYDEYYEEMEHDYEQLIFAILSSEALENLLDKILDMEEYGVVVDKIVNAEALGMLLEEIFESEDFKFIYNEIIALEGYQNYLEDVKELPLYDVLVERYGEKYFDDSIIETNIDMDEYLSVIADMLKDKDYIQFTLDSLKLQSYLDFYYSADEGEMDKLEDEQFVEAIENLEFDILFSDSFNALMVELEELEELEEFKGLILKIAFLPELEELINLYEEGEQEIMDKYEIYY